MTEYTALEKHACPACGAQAVWSARKHLLICPFCGTQSPAELDADTGKIVEHDLAAALRAMPDAWRGWDAERKSVRCRSCKAVTVFDPAKIGKTCDFCGSPELLDYEEINAPIKPESVLPFRVNQEEVYHIIKAWLGSHWLAPNNLKRESLVDTIRGIYIPYWTFDSFVDCRWEAESGDYYYVTRQVRDANGQSRTVQERRVRWYPSSGRLQHAFDDLLIPGSQGVRRDLLRDLEPFPTSDLLPYDTGYVSGWDIEHYQIVLIEAAEQARQDKLAILSRLAASQVPGDTHRFLKIHPAFSRETFKHILVPLWILAYDYGTQKHQVLVNGVTGAIAGTYPRSPWKMFLIALGILVLILIFFLASR